MEKKKMKIFLSIILCLIIVGCITTSKISELDQKCFNDCMSALGWCNNENYEHFGQYFSGCPGVPYYDEDLRNDKLKCWASCYSK